MAWIKSLAVTLGNLAKQERMTCCDLEGAVSPANYVDGLHPDPQGHAQIAQAIWDALRPTLSAALAP